MFDFSPTYKVRPNEDPVVDTALLKIAHWVARHRGRYENEQRAWVVSAPSRSRVLREPRIQATRLGALRNANTVQGFPGIEWALWAEDESWHVLIAANGDLSSYKSQMMISLIVGDNKRLHHDMGMLATLALAD